MLPTTPARMTHDYVRNGTTSLFAALDLASGPVIAQPYRRHRHQEFLRFLKLIDAAVPNGLELHLVLDNYATHKTPAIHQWLLKHPRFHLHFTPTSSSWMNLALVRRADEPQAAAVSAPQRRRAGNRHPQVDQRVEQEPQAVRMDQDGRRDPRNPRRLLPTHHRLRTLEDTTMRAAQLALAGLNPFLTGNDVWSLCSRDGCLARASRRRSLRTSRTASSMAMPDSAPQNAGRRWRGGCCVWGIGRRWGSG
jgi:hypothetical protein